MNELLSESFLVFKKKGVFLRNVSFLVFYLSLLTWDLVQERKQESSRVVTEAPKTKPRPPSCQKNSPTQATSCTPTVSSCTGSSAAGYWSPRSPLLWPVVTVEHIPGGSTGSSLIFWWGLCLHLLSLSVMACCRKASVKWSTSIIK